jgi:hypothetical protein
MVRSNDAEDSTNPTSASDKPPLPTATTCYTQSDPTDPFHRLTDPALAPAARSIILLRKRFRSLSETQFNAVELLVLGHTQKRVAKLVDVHRVTVTRWCLYNPHFQAALSQRRQEVWGSAADGFRHTLRSALKVVRKQLKSEDETVAFRAARALLHFAGSNKFAPPPDPVDVHGVIERLARKRKIQSHLYDDPLAALLDDEDFLAALSELDEKQLNFPLGADPDANPSDCGFAPAPADASPPTPAR